MVSEGEGEEGKEEGPLHFFHLRRCWREPDVKIKFSLLGIYLHI